MNPTAGSFTINPRLQRQFAVFAVSFPGMDALESIYKQIFTSHLEFNKFSGTISNRLLLFGALKAINQLKSDIILKSI